MEKLLGKRRRQGVTEYLVKWKSYGPEHNSWEPETELPDQVVQKFQSKQKRDREASKKPRL